MANHWPINGRYLDQVASELSCRLDMNLDFDNVFELAFGLVLFISSFFGKPTTIGLGKIKFDYQWGIRILGLMFIALGTIFLAD